MSMAGTVRFPRPPSDQKCAAMHSPTSVQSGGTSMLATAGELSPLENIFVVSFCNMLLPLCRCCKSRIFGDSEHQLSKVYLLGAGTPSSIKSFPAESLFLEAQVLPQSATAGQTSRGAAEATFPCKPHTQTDIVDEG